MYWFVGNLNLVDGCKYNVFYVIFYVNFSIIIKLRKFLDFVYNIGIGV